MNKFLEKCIFRELSCRCLSSSPTYLNKYKFHSNGGFSRELTCEIDSVSLIPGKYYIDLIIVKYMEDGKLSSLSDVANFNVIESNNFIFSNKIKPMYHGNFIMKYNWK